MVVICVGIYTLSTLLLWRRAKSNTSNDNSSNDMPWHIISGLIASAILLHGYLLYSSFYSNSKINISMGLAISMAGWISVALYLAISFLKKTINLGLIVLPVGLITLLAGALFSGNTLSTDQIPQGMGFHIALAIPTYGILFVAFAQACLLIIQDRQLQKPNPGNILPALPAIQTMESNLFWLTLLGFLLMTANLIIGMASNLRYSGSILEFNHHILLSIIAWIGFGSLLLGRKIAGWRGEIAAKWTIIAFAILVLAYFGTRFVNDLVLGS